MPVLADKLRCALSSAAVVALASFRIAEASGNGELAFFDDVGDDDAGVSLGDALADDTRVDVVGAAVEEVTGATEDDGEDDGDGPDEQPASSAAAALTTVKTAGSLRMTAMVEGAFEPGTGCYANEK